MGNITGRNHHTQQSQHQSLPVQHGHDHVVAHNLHIFKPIFNAENVTLLTRLQDEYKGNKHFYHYNFSQHLIFGFYRIHGINPTDIATNIPTADITP